MVICIYGAASNVIDVKYIEAVEALGEKLAKKGHGLVYGGGAEGLMGAAARGFKRGGGYVCGIAPSFFTEGGDDVLFNNCDEFIYTETMRERKQKMEDRADCFIMAPGGIGTFEEFFEILTLKQLRRHEKAIAVYNIDGYYDLMEDMLSRAITEGFMKESCRKLYKVLNNEDELVNYLESYVPQKALPKEYKNI